MVQVKTPVLGEAPAASPSAPDLNARPLKKSRSDESVNVIEDKENASPASQVELTNPGVAKKKEEVAKDQEPAKDANMDTTEETTDLAADAESAAVAADTDGVAADEDTVPADAEAAAESDAEADSGATDEKSAEPTHSVETTLAEEAPEPTADRSD
mmetsp:Transcript_16089/g.48332  ORF Transcript_16089/g.48332 Transcript_16089/m.48332 type:complete len:157 (+) Transcript_16089:125-595(+)|eukprot:CAMPEP_0174241482 /NCGR_PEP_ID=MMETSP0417-20130205/23526_1 /TAXON_ID=242541 /ORGANISM="Mayorella sp, Strain BSH-02190019" /LENGTH=156 /DNA_ID=CAMNT_0015320727 /DNA_START=100 /DNA_END=570 /DNA_ORIENTATION=+